MLRLATAIAGLALTAIPAVASAATYAATPVVRPAAQRINGADVRWACGTDACVGSTDESRPMVLCQDLASHAGRLTSFLVNGSSFTPADLDRCNAKAKGPAPLARAN